VRCEALREAHGLGRGEVGCDQVDGGFELHHQVSGPHLAVVVDIDDQPGLRAIAGLEGVDDAIAATRYVTTDGDVYVRLPLPEYRPGEPRQLDHIAARRSGPGEGRQAGIDGGREGEGIHRRGCAITGPEDESV